MITKWKAFNFKSIREETELDLRLLTIFAGANSSGKSTFIQSILLVAQTLAHKVGSRSVVLNGAFASLGQFDDLKSNDGESDQITIKCTCRPLFDHITQLPRRSIFATRGSIYYGSRPNSFQEVACEMSFDANPSSSQRELFQIHPRLFATVLSCVSRDEDNIDQTANISIHHSDKAISENNRIGVASELNDQFRSGLAYKVNLDENSMAEVKEDLRSARPIGCVLRHFLPDRIIYSLDTIKEDANTIVLALQDFRPHSTIGRWRRMRNEMLLSEEVIAVLRRVLKDTIDFDQVFGDALQRSLLESDSNALAISVWRKKLMELKPKERLEVQRALRECHNFYECIYEAMKASSTPNSEIDAFTQTHPPRLITEAALYLDNYFASSLKYLGPLRDAPKPLYPLAPAADPRDVGLRGEHTASILELHKNKQIRYIPSDNFKSPVIERKTATRTLETAVIDWLQYLGVASSVESRDQGKLGHELKVGLFDSDSTHDLTHVGVGVSQVLPILVMCLLVESDSTLVFEQPELHLHPKVQTLLGDFFLSMSLCNKQCIVETHSEYLIDRLRFRIAAASSANELNDKTMIYFVEKPSQGSSSFREVVINEFGAISDWPEGFFDQSQQQAEEILHAAAMKRKVKRRKNDV